MYIAFLEMFRWLRSQFRFVSSQQRHWQILMLPMPMMLMLFSAENPLVRARRLKICCASMRKMDISLLVHIHFTFHTKKFTLKLKWIRAWFASLSTFHALLKARIPALREKLKCVVTQKIKQHFSLWQQRIQQQQQQKGQFHCFIDMQYAVGQKA